MQGAGLSHSDKVCFPAPTQEISELITNIPRRTYRLPLGTRRLTRTESSLYSTAARHMCKDNMLFCLMRRALMNHLPIFFFFRKMLQTETHSVLARGFCFFEAATFLHQTPLEESYITARRCIILPSKSDVSFSLHWEITCWRGDKRLGNILLYFVKIQTSVVAVNWKIASILHCYLLKTTTPNGQKKSKGSKTKNPHDSKYIKLKNILNETLKYKAILNLLRKNPNQQKTFQVKQKQSSIFRRHSDLLALRSGWPTLKMTGYC